VLTVVADEFQGIRGDEDRVDLLLERRAVPAQRLDEALGEGSQSIFTRKDGLPPR
jgi:hypothetical protein